MTCMKKYDDLYMSCFGFNCLNQINDPNEIEADIKWLTENFLKRQDQNQIFSEWIDAVYKLNRENYMKALNKYRDDLSEYYNLSTIERQYATPPGKPIEVLNNEYYRHLKRLGRNIFGGNA